MTLSASAVGSTLVDELVAQGVTDVVISPGSRSTPLTLAALVNPKLRTYMRIDERSAAFLALGIAKGNIATGVKRAVAIICTSGTAGANHVAAVREADASGAPLIVITADRPQELHGIGANQTMEQSDLHGDSVRKYFSIVDHGEGVEAAASIRNLITQAVAISTGVRHNFPGPVHINVQLREPLAEIPWEAKPIGVSSVRVHSPHKKADGVLYELVGLLSATDRVLVVAGDGVHPDDQEILNEECGRLGWPLIAEPTSGVRRGATLISHGQWLVSSLEFSVQSAPEVVIVLGRPSLGKDVISFISRAREVIQFDPDGRGLNPTREATHLVMCPISDLLSDVEHRPSNEWLELWQSANTKVALAVNEAVAEDNGEIRAIKDTVEYMLTYESTHMLVCSSSTPIRIVNEVVPSLGFLPVIANRGVSGIDGFLSTAIGAAISTQRRSIAITGDLSFLHDLPGLVGSMNEEERHANITFLVINNNGGGIFERLGHLKGVDENIFRRAFITPHNLSAAAIARAMGIEATTIKSPRDVTSVLSKIPDEPGIRVVECICDVADNKETEAAIRLALSEIL